MASLLPMAFFSIVLYFCFRVIYNAFIHPLAQFPGPFLARVSNAPYSYWYLAGRQPYVFLELHKKYGPVVRVAPNELSFSTARSFRDIYGYREGKVIFIKSDFYDGGAFPGEARSIVSERDPARHAEMRKQLHPNFSDRSLAEQEADIQDLMDRFLARLGKTGATGANMTSEFELLTFDIIGLMAFGETSGNVDSGKHHPWIKASLDGLTMGAVADTFARFPFVAAVVKIIFTRRLGRLFAQHRKNQQYSISQVQKRRNRTATRKDFYTRILEQTESSSLSEVQFAAHASDIVLAGSETTATTLATITWYLLRNPAIMEKLKEEIRSSFKDYTDITAVSTSSLQYLNQVILEGLRIYPAVPRGLPRVLPDEGASVDGNFIPGKTIVSTNPVVASLSDAHFKSPWEFLPERWSRNELLKDELDASQPFSLGPRGCIGKSLSFMEMRLLLAKMHFLHDMKLLNHDMDWHRDSRMLTLWKKPELWIQISPRELHK